MLKDYPEIHDAFKKLQAEREKILKKCAPLRERHHALQAQLDKLRAEQIEVAEQIKAIQRPALVDIDARLSVMARATGGKALNS
jgi:predicted nuclease with TOPRIM domain